MSRPIRETDILKAVLLLRKCNCHKAKEEQRNEIRNWLYERYISPEEFWNWLDWLRNPIETCESDYEGDYDSPLFDEEEEYTSSTNGDYSPGNPWDAPGMSISDFI